MSPRAAKLTAPAAPPQDPSLAEEAAERSRRAARDLAASQALARAALSPEDPEPEPEEAAPSRLDLILDTVRDQGKFEVFRQVAGGQKSKVGVYPVSEYPEKMEVIAAEYKGGTFTIIFKDSHGRIRGQDTQTFDPTAYGKGSTMTPEPARPDPTAALSSMFEKMLERAESREAAFRVEQAEARRIQAEREMKFLELMATARAPREEVSILDAIKLGQSMAAQQAPQNPMSVLKETLEIVATLREGQDLGEPKSPWLVALDRATEVLTPLISVLASKAVGVENPPHPGSSVRATLRTAPATSPGQAGRSLPAPAPARTTLSPSAGQPQPPNPSEPRATEPAAAEGAVMSNPPDPKMKALASKLYGAAAVQMRPSIVAQVIVDSITDEMVEDTEKMLEDENLVPSIIASEPKLGIYEAWLRSVMKEVSELFDEKFPPEEEAAEAIPAEAVPATDAAPAPETPAPAPVPAPEPAAPPPPEAVNA